VPRDDLHGKLQRNRFAWNRMKISLKQGFARTKREIL
jgi:hypothetical protein